MEPAKRAAEEPPEPNTEKKSRSSKAPAEAAPQGPQVVLNGHYSPIGIIPGKNATGWVQVYGMPQSMQAVLKALPADPYEQRGAEYDSVWKWNFFQPHRPCYGQGKDCLWQKDIGKEGTPLALVKMPGAMLKAACNEVFAKKIFDETIRLLRQHGFNVKGEWKISGWESKKNILSVRVADGDNLFLHGNPSFVHREALCTKYPDLCCEKAHLDLLRCSQLMIIDDECPFM